MRRKIVRRSVDQVAGQEDGVACASELRSVNTGRQKQPRSVRLRLAVTVEAIACERKRQRRKLRSIGALQPIIPGWKRGGELAEDERVALGRIRVAESEEDAADISFSIRDDEMPAGLRLETLRLRETALALVERGERSVAVFR